jgi:hypothetical protein
MLTIVGSSPSRAFFVNADDVPNFLFRQLIAPVSSLLQGLFPYLMQSTVGRV